MSTPNNKKGVHCALNLTNNFGNSFSSLTVSNKSHICDSHQRYVRSTLNNLSAFYTCTYCPCPKLFAMQTELAGDCAELEHKHILIRDPVLMFSEPKSRFRSLLMPVMIASDRYCAGRAEVSLSLEQQLLDQWHLTQKHGQIEMHPKYLDSASGTEEKKSTAGFMGY